jgi:Skp family chaperone for outer membrane proteins
MQTDIQRAQEDAQREGQSRTNAVLESLDSQLGPIVRQVAEEKNLHLVLQFRPDLDIIFVDPSIDITADVIAKFNASGGDTADAVQE